MHFSLILKSVNIFSTAQYIEIYMHTSAFVLLYVYTERRVQLRHRKGLFPCVYYKYYNYRCYSILQVHASHEQV